MKRDKEWLKDEVRKLEKFKVEGTVFHFLKSDAVILYNVLELIDQLEEPKKVVVPQIAAEWIAELKSYSDVDIFEEVEDIRGVLSSQNMHKEHAIWGWIEGHKDDFMRAWLEHPNIEVEKEPLYYVELPASIWNDDTSELEDKFFYLKYQIESDEFTLSLHKGDTLGWRGKLTEQQIKSIDENYWAFAKPVKEV